MQAELPRVLSAGGLTPTIHELLANRVELLPWEAAQGAAADSVAGIFSYGHDPVDELLLARLSNLRVISNHGVGVDHIDVEAARRRGIPVGNTPAILDAAVADMAMALLLAAARRLAEGDRFARTSGATEFDPSALHGRDVHGATLGIVGLGNIGYQIARRARGFDMRIVYHNRNRREAVERELAAEYLSLDDLLATADFLVLICPLSDSTRGLIGRRELAQMKPTATLVNIARGGVVDTGALTAALQERSIYAAALDVTDPEPLPADHPLLALDNVTLTPHLGSATVETRRRMAELAVDNLLAGLAGEEMKCRVV
ncbi:MAG: D-glycerate dehydrogenase [Planctomycetales bacterium]|nr:D-glycerate dehydrogenase [Planctomycetales bacterium]